MNFNDKVIIVTGSATGIGAACVQLLAAQGARVVVNYSRNAAAAEATAQACRDAGGEALLVKANVAQDADCRRMAQAALDTWGRIDGLVNNAGTTKFVGLRDLDGLSAEDFQRIYAVNLIGSFQMARACAAALRASHGAIVNVSSISTHDGTGSSLAYACSKGAINTLTLGLAKSLGPEVRVNAVLPGLMKTPMVERSVGLAASYAGGDVEAMWRARDAQAPMGHMGDAWDVAHAVLFLASDEAKYITGVELPVDGGITLKLG